MALKTSKNLYARRTKRTRFKLRKSANARLRLSVFRSGKHIYAQVIDDSKGATIVAASSIDKELKSKLGKGTDIAAATAVGKLVAERALAAGLKEVFFDRGGRIYHGRVKALAESAREAGLSF